MLFEQEQLYTKGMDSTVRLTDILSGRLGDWRITKEYLEYLDVLVDGPFIEKKKNLSLRFRGSENQRLIDVPASLACGKVVLWCEA